jgi:hypothetical protein
MWSYLEKLSRRECHSCKTSSLARVTQRWPRLRHQRRKPLFACLHHWEDGHRQVYSDRDDGASGFGARGRCGSNPPAPTCQLVSNRRNPTCFSAPARPPVACRAADNGGPAAPADSPLCHIRAERRPPISCRLPEGFLHCKHRRHQSRRQPDKKSNLRRSIDEKRCLPSVE